jgi:hypothetical protein
MDTDRMWIFNNGFRVSLGKAVVVPLYKKEDRKECSSYRGISFLSIPGKACTKILQL